MGEGRARDEFRKDFGCPGLKDSGSLRDFEVGVTSFNLHFQSIPEGRLEEEPVEME